MTSARSGEDYQHSDEYESNGEETGVKKQLASEARDDRIKVHQQLPSESNDDDISLGEEARLLRLNDTTGESGKYIKDYIINNAAGIISYFALLVAFVILFIKINVTGTSTMSTIVAQYISQRKLLQEINHTLESIKTLERENEEIDRMIKKFRPVIEAIKNRVKKIEAGVVESAQYIVSPGFSHLELSCSNILEKNPTSASGYYFIKTETGQLRSVFCKMDGCTYDKGGWMRLTKFNITNCPLGLKFKGFNGTTGTCVVERDDPGCTELRYSNLDIPYSKVCGRVTGYFVGTPDGFHRFQKLNLLDNYVDGIAISSKNDHIWSFAAGHCACHWNKLHPVPQFVHDDYTCANAWPNCNVPGEICLQVIIGESQKCRANLDMFKKDLTNRNADISVRICRDQGRDDEDITLTSMEIYVQ